MCSEKALREVPILWQDTTPYERIVNPVYPVRAILVLDSMAVIAPILHYLSAPASSLLVYLEEYHVAIFRYTNLVQVFQTLYNEWVNESPEPGSEIRITVEAHRSGDIFERNCA